MEQAHVDRDEPASLPPVSGQSAEQARETHAPLHALSRLVQAGRHSYKLARQAQLLATHGYFVNTNYSDRTVPFDHIPNGFAADKRADEIMRSTRYVHEGEPLMAGRANNIAAALELLASLGG
jgi:hypothetical protein